MAIITIIQAVIKSNQAKKWMHINNNIFCYILLLVQSVLCEPHLAVYCRLSIVSSMAYVYRVLLFSALHSMVPSIFLTILPCVSFISVFSAVLFLETKTHYHYVNAFTWCLSPLLFCCHKQKMYVNHKFVEDLVKLCVSGNHQI